MKRAREKVWPREREGAMPATNTLGYARNNISKATGFETPSRPGDRVGQAVEKGGGTEG